MTACVVTDAAVCDRALHAARETYRKLRLRRRDVHEDHPVTTHATLAVAIALAAPPSPLVLTVRRDVILHALHCQISH